MTAPRSIHELVADQARRTPTAVALSQQGRELTYDALERRSNSLRESLTAAGVRPGDIVVVAMERSIELIVALLAVLKSGGAYLYIDPSEPTEPRAQILRDSKAGFAVATTTTEDAVSAVACVLNFDRATQAVEPTGSGRAPMVHPSNPAYVCYTSGSTGEPKGVVVPHEAIFRLVHSPSWIQLHESDVFFQLTRVGFDVSTFEIWTPLVRGLRLALGPPQHADLDLADLADSIRNEGVTVLWLTTGLFHKMVTHHIEGLSAIRHLLAGGDVLSPSHVRRAMQTYPSLIFTNGYGPTENTTFSTCWTTQTPSEATRVPIGQAVDGSTAAVLDDSLHRLPAGERGELWVGGRGLALGYLHRPAATAARFVADPDPQSPPGSRMYRTGDQARLSSDGQLDYLGRNDRQVKIRGYRVELSSVEVELMRQHGVQEAAVFTRTDGAGDTRLVAYVAVGNSVQSDEWNSFGRGLRDSLQATLPPHLIPWAIIVRADIPLNPNGKVDRLSLPNEKIPRNVSTQYVDPKDPLEQQLAELWSDALGISAVGTIDNFFDLGGHSLLAAELLAKLESTFNVPVTARTLYLRPTVAQLAAELRGHLPADQETSSVPRT